MWPRPAARVLRGVARPARSRGSAGCPRSSRSPAGGTSFPSCASGRARDERVVDPDEVVRRDPEIILASWCGKPVDARRDRRPPGLASGERGDERAASTRWTGLISCVRARRVLVGLCAGSTRSCSRALESVTGSPAPSGSAFAQTPIKCVELLRVGRHRQADSARPVTITDGGPLGPDARMKLLRAPLKEKRHAGAP